MKAREMTRPLRRSVSEARSRPASSGNLNGRPSGPKPLRSRRLVYVSVERQGA
jgi:hypothetical protein